MKGQFQYEVIANAGHAVQEDSPSKVAEIFATLVNRYKPIFKSKRAWEGLLYIVFK